MGQTYFLELSKVQNTLFLYLYTSRSGAKKVKICYTKKPFFSKYLKNGVQEGLLSHTTSYTGLWMLKMGLSRKIFFLNYDPWLRHCAYVVDWIQEPDSEGKKLSRKLSRKLSWKLSRKLSWDVLSILWKVKFFSTEIPLSILKTQKNCPEKGKTGSWHMSGNQNCISW